MSGLEGLPERVFKFLEAGVIAEFATVSAAGIPIDTPLYYFPRDDMTTFDVATGLPNPAKAERARRNPKIGLLMEGAADEPVVAMRAHAAVRDADLKANTLRYLAETGLEQVSHGLSWEQARKTVTYWSRIIIENTPLRILWWENSVAMDRPPQVWEAPAGTVCPSSDPAPSGEMKPSAWCARPWQEVARDVQNRGLGARLTVLDGDGYPMPMRARRFELVDDGYCLVMPRGVPWSYAGRATLTFAGFHTFVGEAIAQNNAVFFKVERALPELPSTKDTKEVLQPSENTRRNTMARLEHEVKRRGQAIPTVPVDPPRLTRLAKLRQARIACGAPVTGITVEKAN